MKRASLILTATSLALLAAVGSTASGKILRAPKILASNGVARAANNDLRLTANLGGGDAPQAKSTYRERTRNGVLEVRWKVELEDFAPGVDVPVAINGTPVGIIIPNGFGAGVIQFRTSVDDPGDGVPLPEGFPRLHAGDTVTVGNLSGTYN